ncbi:helix-turn-helix domain-containing protein [Paenibacillus flagellatus]|nr:helix-turn-helix domain-containing protein [Paenibacillus flagellatus]
MKSKLSSKAVVTYGLVFFVMITLTVWLSYVGSTGRLQSELNYTNVELLKQIDQKIEMMLREIDKDVLKLTEELEFVYFMHDSYSDNAHKYSNFYGLTSKIKSVMSANPHISSLYLYSGASGNVLTDKAFSVAKDFPDQQWIGEFERMEGFTKWLSTRSIQDEKIDKNVVTLVRSYPPVSSPGFRKGVVAVNIDENLLHDMIKDVYVERLGHTFLIDAEANVVSHDDKKRLFQNLRDEPPVAAILAKPGNGYIHGKWNGEDSSVFYVTSAYTGWKIVSVVPEAKMTKPLTVTRNLLLAVAVAMFVVAVALVFFVSNRTFRPLERLIGRVAGSDKLQAGTDKRQGGLTYLEAAFERMISDREHMQQQIRDTKPAMKWRLVMDMLTGYRAEYAKIRHHLDFAGIQLHPSHYIVFSAELAWKDGEAAPQDIHLYTYVLCNVAEELINMENKGVAIETGDGRAAIVMSFAEGDAEQNQLRALAAADLIRDVMRSQFRRGVTIGVGRCCADLKDIPKSYEESLRALQYRMVMGNESVISIDDLQLLDDKKYVRVALMSDQVAEALKQADAAKRDALLEKLFLEAVRSQFSPEMLRQLGFELVMKSIKTAGDIGVDVEQISVPIGDIHDRLSQCEEWREAHGYVASFLALLSDKIAEKRSARGKNETVGKVMAYINDHYGESDLSLNRLADLFGLSVPYLSKLFKEHTESNFMDYLIDIRIKASKELLADGSRKVNDVAEAVGYSNIHSFLRAFKKYTGMTPTEYRETLAPDRNVVS